MDTDKQTKQYDPQIYKCLSVIVKYLGTKSESGSVKTELLCQNKCWQTNRQCDYYRAPAFAMQTPW